MEESNKEMENFQKSKVAEIIQEPQTEVPIKGVIASEHDLYKKFFKMLQVGVPAQAVKMKMQTEGVDQNILE